MYLELQERKNVNLYVGHPLSDEWGPYLVLMESGSANEFKEKDVEMDALGSKQGLLSNSAISEASEITHGIDSKEDVYQLSGLNNDVKNI